MQCPQCQTPIDTDAAPSQCPQCGASIASAAGTSVARGSKGHPLLIVALVAIAVGVTLAGLYMFQQRTLAEENLARAQHDAAQATAAVDEYTAALLTNSKLKETESVRKELLRPILAYYEKFVQAHANDEDHLREVTAAQFHVAALQAKLGSKQATSSLNQGFGYLNQLRRSKVDPQTFPSLQESALKLVAPTDWIGIKLGTSSISQADGAGLLLMYTTGTATLNALAEKNPKIITFRSDQAGWHRTMASLMALAGQRNLCLNTWLLARDVLETLVKDQPDNVDFQNRLVEALVAAGKLQRAEGARDDAIANYTRAVEIRQQLAAAAPDDAALQKDLATVQRDLEKLQAAAPAAAKAAPAADTPAATTEPPAAEK